ncbi:hypothetical protein BD309DRAFT_963191 [Dichomitus squalens]|uniref:Uncharacterized protein n=1 Tax=Dichomitus squalens TaxID=114155 RepID=A0A4Q9MA78_9APHY|nr:hypothetical protein BD311DRAFT_767365 [Dichomitus squalens]TBU42350.1 hypothetical protein BD309DRAFT_963191 [Dichomitus squalens]
MRNRTGSTRPRNADENAMSRHVRQASGIALAGASKVPVGHTVKNGVQRPVLTEVTTTAVNRTGKVRFFSSFVSCSPLGLLSHGWVPCLLAMDSKCRVVVATVIVGLCCPPTQSTTYMWLHAGRQSRQRV